MKVLEISVESHRGLIPIQGWANVEKALTLYASGKTQGSGDTRKQLFDDVGDSGGGMASAMLLLAESKLDPDRLTKNLLKEASDALKTRDAWSYGFDYDGMGTAFFKTTVRIERLDRAEEVYGLGLNAAYVGTKPEIELAKNLGLTQALYRASVVVTVERAGENSFSFDFDSVMQKLSTIKGLRKKTGAQFVTALMESTEDRPAVSLGTIDGYSVTLGPYGVAPRIDYGTAKRRETWSPSGSVLTGELARDYTSEDREAKDDPSFLVNVSRPDKYAAPLWRHEEQQKMIAVAERIKQALQ